MEEKWAELKRQLEAQEITSAEYDAQAMALAAEYGLPAEG